MYLLFWLTYLAYWAYLIDVFGVLVGILGVMVGVIGVGMLYLLHFVFGMAYLVSVILSPGTSNGGVYRTSNDGTEGPRMAAHSTKYEI